MKTLARKQSTEETDGSVAGRVLYIYNIWLNEMKLTPQLGDHPYCCTSATAFQSEIPSKPPSLSITTLKISTLSLSKR